MTWNKLNTFQWFRERVYKLEESDWDPTDRVAAFELSLSTFHDLTCTPDDCRVPIGVFYKEDGPTDLRRRARGHQGTRVAAGQLSHETSDRSWRSSR